MDIRIENGDICLNDAGQSELIGGLEETAQRVRIAASALRGSFRYNRQLGADYSSVTADDPLAKEKLELLIGEAAEGAADTRITLDSFDPDSRRAVIRLSRGDETMITEADLNGYI